MLVRLPLIYLLLLVGINLVAEYDGGFMGSLGGGCIASAVLLLHWKELYGND